MTDNVDTDSDSELPGGWEERVTIDGRVYYANHASETTQWEHPSTGKTFHVSGELPFGWEQLVTEQGSVYYVDHMKKRSTFTDPRLAFAKEDQISNKVKKPINIRPKFDGSSTASQVLEGQDLTGKYVIITGASSGIGLETAKCLAEHGAHVTMACRDIEKADKAKDHIVKGIKHANLNAMKCDLSSFKNICDFSKKYMQQKWPLHILILNAGVLDPPVVKTEDGFHTTFQVCHLGHFLLVKCLQDLLKKSAPARVVVVSSESHRTSNMTIDNVNECLLFDEKDHRQLGSALTMYGHAKLCNILFCRELHNRFYQSGVTCNAVHPGNLIYTGLQKTRYIWWLLFILARPFTKSLAQGAATTVYVATHRDMEGIGGLYFNNSWQCVVSDVASNTKLGSKLWNISDKCISSAWCQFRASQNE